MKIGVLLSGCGVNDGSEIHESVLTLLAIKEQGAEYVCISIDKNQNDVINHVSGEPMNETRNMLVESARIARGEIQAINTISPADIDALIIPGGSGNAKNLTDWAFNGPDGTILPEVKLLLVNMHNVGKPIAGLCVSPVVIAQALADSNCEPSLTIGTTKAASPYSIDGFNKGLEKTGAHVVEKPVTDIQIDEVNRIVTAPCYMMNASIVEVRENISQAVRALISLAN